jgi:mRNA interferase MazF
MVKRFQVWNIELNPAVGHEISKTRPCVIISPDEANKYLKTVIVVPLTSTIKKYPTRVNCKFNDKPGQLAIDQMRAVDITRLIEKLGILKEETSRILCHTIEMMFKY